MNTNTRVVLYKEVKVDHENTEWKVVDFGVQSKIEQYKKMGFMVVLWVVEKIKVVKESADEKWSRFRRVVERATKLILTPTQMLFA